MTSTFLWAAFFVMTGVHAIYLVGTFLPRLGLFARAVSRFKDHGQREICLTLDDGPEPEMTPRVLRLLEQHNAKAIFFLIGDKAAAYPELVRQILAAGHQLGNHTQHHWAAWFWAAPTQLVKREIEECAAVLRKLSGEEVRYFRPPVGMVSPFVGKALAGRHERLILWSERGFDTVNKEPEKVAAKMLAGCRPGAILLAHPELGEAQLRALALVLEGLREQGLRCVIPEEDQFLAG